MRGAATLCLLAAAAALGSEKKTGSSLEPHRLFLARCSTCHDPGRVYHRRADRDEWREVVRRMQRMPQSGIAPREADRIIDYLVSLRGRTRAPANDGRESVGGREAYGKEWLSVLEIATVSEGGVRLGGRDYKVEVDGRSAVLTRGRKSHLVGLDDRGRPAATARVNGWKIGDTAYEIHLVFYEIRAGRVRLGRALRRTP